MWLLWLLGYIAMGIFTTRQIVKKYKLLGELDTCDCTLITLIVLFWPATFVVLFILALISGFSWAVLGVWPDIDDLL